MNFVFNKNIDFVLIQFPIIFSLICGLILFLVPGSEIYLIFFTILLLAETHSGVTWAIFFEKLNYNYFDKKKNAWFLDQYNNLFDFEVDSQLLKQRSIRKSFKLF